MPCSWQEGKLADVAGLLSRTCLRDDLRIFGGSAGSQKLVFRTIRRWKITKMSPASGFWIAKEERNMIIVVGEFSPKYQLDPSPALQVVVSAISVTAWLTPSRCSHSDI